ncbi:MAG: hypothetical protein KDI61_06635 [Alphaproteobacteria bacterium]|nr:hypothetical protein [Alphaproteobacteria bacterium]MCB1839919.1 hypothetical protein [Alphaproteobacteria bacterium]
MTRRFSTPSGFDRVPEKDLPVAVGVYCDVSGTLITYDQGSPEIRTDEDVVAFLRYVRDVRRRPVTLCSRVQENALAPGALREEFGFIVGKAVYRDQRMEVLIDNNPDEYLSAESKFGPEKLRGFANLTLDRQHEIYARLTGDTAPPPVQDRDFAAFEQ